MDSASVAADFITAANATTGFAIIQNIALSYALIKRELNFRIDRKWQPILAAVGILWNSLYVVVIWWCTASAIAVSVDLDPSLRSAVERLGLAKCVAAAFFGFCSVWIIVVYNYKPFWHEASTQPSAPARHLHDGDQQGAPADAAKRRG